MKRFPLQSHFLVTVIGWPSRVFNAAPLTVSVSPGLQDAVLLLGAVQQGHGVGVQHVALDVIQVERGKLRPTHHAEQAAGLRLVLHQELLTKPGVQGVVQVPLQGLRRRAGSLLRLLLWLLEVPPLHRVRRQRGGFFMPFWGGRSVCRVCWWSEKRM